jgi:uncharacterized membrane protein YdjX (TVP38/TMEM64 family)
MNKKKWLSILSLCMFMCIIAYYIHLLHTGEAQKMMHTVQRMGFFGVLLGIAIQSIANILPTPGEIVSVILMEIYGPIYGGLMSWVGAVIGAVGGLYLAKWLAKPFLGDKHPLFLQKVDRIIKKRETSGMLFVRVIPLFPYHLVNYAAGILHIKLWKFIWTTAIGVLPFTIAMTGVYAGVRHGSFIWGFIGGGIFLVLVYAGYKIKKKNNL